ncbi:MAG: NYN domain-containing protein [Candidatus Saccharimonadales bacterium]
MRVFIDGENLRHRIAQVLWEERLIDAHDQPFNFDVTKLLTTVLGQGPEEIAYYTSHVKLPDFEIPEKLIHKIASIQEQNRRWIAQLTNNGVNVIKAGNLKVQDSPRCLHCGKRSQILQEKGVDVRFATDIVLAGTRDKVMHMVVLSSDADMIPALEVVRAAGVKVTYLCFGEETNHAVAQNVDQTVSYSRQDIVNVFKHREAAPHETTA